MFWPIRRSILYLASWRLVIASSLFVPSPARSSPRDDCPEEPCRVLRIAPSSVQVHCPEPTGLAPKRRPQTAGRETPRGPIGPRSARFLRRKLGSVKRGRLSGDRVNALIRAHAKARE